MIQNNPMMLHSSVSIEVKDLSVNLGGRKIIDIPSLAVFQNEVLAIIGPNGSGKTTLLLALAALLKPEKESSVIYWGRPVKYGSDIYKLRRQFAVLFQEPLLLSGNAWDNVTLGLRLRGVRKEEINLRAKKWMERFGIFGLAKQQVKTLSGGEAKRVSLARAFVLQPEILFLDEPFTALDSPTRQALLEDFESVLRETKITTVMVTHDRNEALVVAHRVAVLIGGRLRQLGRPDEVFNYPVDEEVAEFVEAGNILEGTIIEQNNGIAAVNIGKRQIEVVSHLPVNTRVIVCLRFEDITLSVHVVGEAFSSARNRLKGVITRALPFAAQVRISIDCGLPLVAVITKRSYNEMELAEGKEIIATFKASSIHLIPHH